MSNEGCVLESAILGLGDANGHSSEEEKTDAKRRKIEFVVRLCSDVFLDVVRWGHRRQLVALEKIGRRLHWLIDGCIREAPFLCFDLILVPLQSIRLSGKQISQAELATAPSFVRFNTVLLDYFITMEAIKQKCEWVTMLLQPLKQALSGSKFHFQCAVSNLLYDFIDNSMLFEHMEEKLLPICNACSSYNFEIDSNFQVPSPQTEVIAKFLQFYQIAACSNVVLALKPGYEGYQIELPVDVIANWLHRNRNRNYDSIAAKSVEGKEQILEICTDGYISNVSAMLSCLKKVFREALSPTRTFTLRLKFPNEFDEEIGHGEKISNRKTGEEFSIVWHCFGSLEIKRTAAKDK